MDGPSTATASWLVRGRLLADAARNCSSARARTAWSTPSAARRGAGASRMSRARTAATATRVLGQLRRDPRTIALLLIVPGSCCRCSFYSTGARPLPIGAPRSRLFPVHLDVPRDPRSRCCANAPPAPRAADDLPSRPRPTSCGYASRSAAVAPLLVATGGFGAGSGPPARLVGLALAVATRCSDGARADSRVRLHRVPGCSVHARVCPSPGCCCAGCSSRARRWSSGSMRSGLLPLSYAFGRT